MDIRLTRLARQDLDEIRRYTVETWGRDQWQRYFSGLMATFERITRERTCGRARDTIKVRMRSLPYQKHLIFFGPIAHAGGEIVILRIVHQTRNLAALAYNDERRG
jgi:toxin ParE1/3/4